MKIDKYICDGCKQERKLPVYRVYQPHDDSPEWHVYTIGTPTSVADQNTYDICSSCDVLMMNLIRTISD